jgi:UDP-glucuronate 4-epimerase
MKPPFTLVTGAAGFIGFALTKELLRRGTSVLALDCFLPDLYSSQLKQEKWDSLESELLQKLPFDLRTDNFSLLEDFEISSIINLAGMPGLSKNWSNSQVYYDCNILGLNRLLEFCRSREIKSFVHASTSSVYGKRAIGGEEQELHPTSPYGVSKLAAEKLLLAYQENYSVPIKILRYFSVYGPHQRPDMAFAKIIDSIFKAREFEIHGNGDQQRSNTYIDDVVEATLLASDRAPVGSILNICGDELFSLQQAISIIEESTGKGLRVKIGPRRYGDQFITFGSNDKAKFLLGWKAKINFREGIRNQIKTYLESRNY